MTKNIFNGKWRIIEMEAWSQESIDLIEAGYIDFHENGKSGALHFICIYADINYEVSSKNKSVFSFQGDDEGDAISGRGWATIKKDELHGRIFIHNGDNSNFKAKLI